MPADQDPKDNRAEQEAESERDALSLTDLFDQMDRAAFKRSLEHRDSAYPVFSNS
jgi:hypothetical protein